MVLSLFQLKEHLNKVSQDSHKFIIAIDGPGGGGKSFFAERLCKILKDAEIVHFDDFYLPIYSSAVIGSNFHWQRLTDQVLLPFKNGDKCAYEVYNWISGQLDSIKQIKDSKYLIVEGVTSARLELRKYLDLIIFIETPLEIRLQRGIERDGPESRDLWINHWMPMEDRYFNSCLHNTKNISNLVIDGTYSENIKSEMIKIIYDKKQIFSID